MKTIMLSILSAVLLMTLSCVGAPKPVTSEPAAQRVSSEPQAPPPNIKAQPIPTPGPDVAKPIAQTMEEHKEMTWTLAKGKLKGPGAFVTAKKISTVKNQKTPGTTSEFCYNYGKFAVVEVISTDEKGALDLFVRFPSEKAKNLCISDYNGKYVGMDVLEGGFAGVAGEYILVDGIDSSEGLTEFQVGSIFAVSATIWVFSSAFWGARSDHWGRRPVILIGLVAFGISTLAFATVMTIGLRHLIAPTMTFVLLVATRSIFGIFGSGAFPASQAYIADRTSAHFRLWREP